MTLTNDDFPAWLNIETLIPAEMRDRIPQCIEEADLVLDAVCEFSDRWTQFIVEVEHATWLDELREDAGDMARFFQQLIGLQQAMDKLNLAEGILSRIDGDTPRYGWPALAEGKVNVHQAESIEALEKARSWASDRLREVVEKQERDKN